MRIMVELADDVLRAAGSLARRGICQRPIFTMESGGPVFHVRPGARSFTLEDVKAALEDDD